MKRSANSLPRQLIIWDTGYLRESSSLTQSVYGYLQNYLHPKNPKSLERMIGMFAYYAKWISRFSDKIKNLKSTTIFPLSGESLLSFQTLKTDLINASLTAISDDLMFVVETDASHNSVSAVLSQDN